MLQRCGEGRDIGQQGGKGGWGLRLSCTQLAAGRNTNHEKSCSSARGEGWESKEDGTNIGQQGGDGQVKVGKGRMQGKSRGRMQEIDGVKIQGMDKERMQEVDKGSMHEVGRGKMQIEKGRMQGMGKVRMKRMEKGRMQGIRKGKMQQAASARPQAMHRILGHYCTGCSHTKCEYSPSSCNPQPDRMPPTRKGPHFLDHRVRTLIL